MSSSFSSQQNASTTSSANALKALQQRIGYQFVNPELLVEAMTQASYVNEHANARSNERLEHLGDAVLGLVMTEVLFERYMHDTEAELTERRKNLVSKPKCAEVAARLDIGRNLRLGVGEELQGGREHPSRLADALEALIGAVHVDCGQNFVTSRKVVLGMYGPIAPAVKSVVGPSSSDAKSTLQIEVQRLLATPEVGIEYRIVRSTGPDHAPMHTVEVLIMGKVHGRGAGSKKKEAEQEAAQGVLDRWDDVSAELEKIAKSKANLWDL